MTKMLWPAVAILAFHFAAVGQPVDGPSVGDQWILVGSIAGAQCTLKQDGKTVFELVEPGMGDERTAKWLDVGRPPSHNELMVTCSKEGYEPQSKTLSFGPQTWIADNAPCTLLKGATRQETEQQCGHYASASTGVTMGFPETVILILKHKD
jgi:hypothetical protein